MDCIVNCDGEGERLGCIADHAHGPHCQVSARDDSMEVHEWEAIGHCKPTLSRWVGSIPRYRYRRRLSEPIASSYGPLGAVVIESGTCIRRGLKMPCWPNDWYSPSI